MVSKPRRLLCVKSAVGEEKTREERRGEEKNREEKRGEDKRGEE